MKVGDLVLRVRVDEDYLRLVAYRDALRRIASGAAAEPWLSGSEEGEMARRVLEHFGDAP